MLGAVLTVEGLDNKKFDITIPAGSQHGSKFRLPQQGLYVMNQTHRGSLIINLNITIPTNLSESQIAVLKNTFNE
jgi:DnaJ-class molecular chaperone